MSMSKLTIRYLLNEEGRKKSLLSNGDGKMIQVLTTDEIDEEKLKYAHVDKNGNAYINVGFRFVSERSEDVDKITTEYEVFVRDYDKIGYYSLSSSDEPKIISKTKEIIYYDNIQNIDSLINDYNILQKKIEENKKVIKKQLKIEREIFKEKLDIAIKKRQEIIDKANIEKEKEKKLKEKINREEKEFKEKLVKEKEQWIKEHGSEYLKTAFNNGYDCQRKYVEERAKFEYPDFYLDFYNKVIIWSRSMPSEKALIDSLNIKDGIFKEAKVIWAKDSYNDNERKNLEKYLNHKFEECEAVMIDEYLGKYRLFKFYEE